jgi:hypothetical protein
MISALGAPRNTFSSAKMATPDRAPPLSLVLAASHTSQRPPLVLRHIAADDEMKRVTECTTRVLKYNQRNEVQKVGLASDERTVTSGIGYQNIGTERRWRGLDGNVIDGMCISLRGARYDG